MRGDFTLPAWSDDGRSIAVVERKENGLALEAFVGSVAAVQKVGACAPEEAVIARSLGLLGVEAPDSM